MNAEELPVNRLACILDIHSLCELTWSRSLSLGLKVHFAKTLHLQSSSGWYELMQFHATQLGILDEI